MDLQDLLRTGKDIVDEVSDAVGRRDYSHLSDSLKEMTDRMHHQKEHADRERQSQIDRQNRQMYGHAASRENTEKDSVPHFSGQAESESGHHSFFGERRTPFLQSHVSRMSGLGSKVLGILIGIGCLPFLIASLVLLAFTGGVAGIVVTAMFAAVEAGGIYLGYRGARRRNLIRDYYHYGSVIGPAEYIQVSQLADRLNTDPDTVHRRLSSMMADGLLPSARFDRSENTLLLTSGAWQQYQQAMEGYRKRADADRKREEEIRNAGTSDEVQKILQEGDEYLRFVHRCNDEIPDPEMSDKLYKLEDITNRIFEQVRKHPSSASDLHKFMDYYLPTTRKLLNAYMDLEHQPEAGANIRDTRREIVSAMDTINEAFENLLDSLFEDMAWDVSSDISAMKTMMSQDGLTDSELKPDGSKEKEDI